MVEMTDPNHVFTVSVDPADYDPADPLYLTVSNRAHQKHHSINRSINQPSNQSIVLRYVGLEPIK